MITERNPTVANSVVADDFRESCCLAVLCCVAQAGIVAVSFWAERQRSESQS